MPQKVKELALAWQSQTDAFTELAKKTSDAASAENKRPAKVRTKPAE
jgi:hypothetical protein